MFSVEKPSKIDPNLLNFRIDLILLQEIILKKIVLKKRSQQKIRFLDYCLLLYCYIPNVSVDVSSGLLQKDKTRQEKLEEGSRTNRLKRWEYNNKEDNSLKTLNDNHQASSQKFRSLKVDYNSNPNGTLNRKPTRVSSSLSGCPIHIVFCHI